MESDQLHDKPNVVYPLKIAHWPFKGTVSQKLRWVLLFIIQKLFSRADVAHNKILILLKGHFTIYKNNPASLQLRNAIPTVLDAANIVCLVYSLSGDMEILYYGIVAAA